MTKHQKPPLPEDAHNRKLMNNGTDGSQARRTVPQRSSKISLSSKIVDGWTRLSVAISDLRFLCPPSATHAVNLPS